MRKPEKQKMIEDLRGRFSKANLTVLVKNNGLPVSDFGELRKKMRAANTEVKVAKNTLACISATGTKFENLKDYYVGPIVTMWTYTEPVALAKQLSACLKDQQKVEFVAGSMDGKLLMQKDFSTLATLPSREELLAKMFGSMKSPMNGIVNVLAGVPRSFLNVLNAIKDTKSN